MRHYALALICAAALSAALVTPAVAGIVDFAIGAYGGMTFPTEEGIDSGTVLGAKLRVLPPIPMVGFEAWYAHFTYEDVGPDLDDGDFYLALEGDGFDLFGVDVLVGSVRGVPGFKWYGIAGVTAVEFEEFGKDESERKLGGELGLGVEILPPALGVGIEARGMMMFPDLSGDFGENLTTVTVGVNYYF